MPIPRLFICNVPGNCVFVPGFKGVITGIRYFNDGVTVPTAANVAIGTSQALTTLTGNRIIQGTVLTGGIDVMNFTAAGQNESYHTLTYPIGPMDAVCLTVDGSWSGQTIFYITQL